LREIAVFGGTAHPALAAGICADRGVRYAAQPGQQRHCLAVLPGRGAGQREPLHDESPDQLGQGREDAEDQPAARGWWYTSCRDRNPVPRRRSPATAHHLAAVRPHSQAAVAARMASSDPDRRGR
jgi:hypothetical protein